MPNYDYKCDKCNTVFEEFQKIADRHVPEKKPCPSCKEQDTVKLTISPVRTIDPVKLGTKKPDKGFQEVMAKIKEKHPRMINRRW